MKIALLDSGVGGLSILRQVKNKIPCAHYIYFMDNAFLPYCNLSEANLIKRIKTISKYIVTHFKPDFFVVACNTASTCVLPALRQTIKIPVIGVIPAIKPALTLSKTNKIGILATPATIKKPYLSNLINSLKTKAHITKVGSSKLVYLSEKKLAGEKICPNTLHLELKGLFSIPQLDTIVLACTHFPHLLKELKDIAPKHYFWVEPSEAIANRIMFLASAYVFNEPDIYTNNTEICYTTESTYVELQKKSHIKEFNKFHLLRI